MCYIKTPESITSGYNYISNALATLNEKKICTGAAVSVCTVLAIYFTFHTRNPTQKPPTPQSTLSPTFDPTHQPTGVPTAAPTAGPTTKPIPDPEGVPYFLQLSGIVAYIAQFEEQHATGFVSVMHVDEVQECLGLKKSGGDCYPSQNGRFRIVGDINRCQRLFSTDTPEVKLCYDHNMKNKEHLRVSTTRPQ